MRKKILNIFKKHPRKLFSQKEIIRRMNFRQQDMVAMKNTLKEMVNAGQIKQVKGKRYALSHQSNTFVGVLTVTQKGFGFVITCLLYTSPSPRDRG